MQQIRISVLRADFCKSSRTVLRGIPLEVTSYGTPVGVLSRSDAYELNSSIPQVPKTELRARLADCCEGFLEGIKAYGVTVHGRQKMVFASPEFAKESGLYE
ncbi:hypothetical protein D0962_09495 [Leptolyngbyaceae cyanobacterium CCMR0082]|uniref:Uncharacterized protein n=1 Tax=Adonisia turfae CCMR0082 TaxID=2304604 RepID=A0A6M0S580_9CYAN|nr:hypothetical protein [Adonisia turfae CCMR0082]